MRFGDVETALVLAAYDQSFREPNRSAKSGDLTDRYLIDPAEGWIHQIVADLGKRGLILGKGVMGDERSQPIRLTAAGMRFAEGLIDNGKVVHERKKVSDPDNVVAAIIEASDAAADFSVQSKSLSDLSNAAVDSSKWTGLPSTFELVEVKRVRLVSDLDKAEETLATLNLSQEVHTQARAYIIAARILAEAPDPPADVIWEIVNRANSLAGIASLFVSILALFH